MFRLLQTVDTHDLVNGLRNHQVEPQAARVSANGVAFLRAEGAKPDALLPRLAAEAAFDDPAIAPAFAVLVGDPLAAL